MKNQIWKTFLTIFVHSNFDAFAETASAALVAMSLVDQTGSLTLGLANVLAIPANRTLKRGQKQSTVSSQLAELKTSQSRTCVIILTTINYLEESSTSIASENAVMFARRVILAHAAGNIVENSTLTKYKSSIPWWNTKFKVHVDYLLDGVELEDLLRRRSMLSTGEDFIGAKLSTQRLRREKSLVQVNPVAHCCRERTRVGMVDVEEKKSTRPDSLSRWLATVEKWTEIWAFDVASQRWRVRVWKGRETGGSGGV